MNIGIESNNIHLINSDEYILKNLNESKVYLNSKIELSSTIDKIMSVFSVLMDLLPQTPDTITSGHVIPIEESHTDLENSIQLCKFGFYKSSIVTLRSVLELGLLSVYWDINNDSQKTIQNWLHALEDTPFKNIIIKKLKTDPNIEKFDSKHKIFKEIEYLFKQLSNYTHSKGYLHSNQNLAKANVNQFNKIAFQKWFDLMKKVVKIVVIVHILKYPIALQYTPIVAKFGLNPIVGTFLQPRDAEKIREFLDNDILKTLQAISDSDPMAIDLAKGINELDNITEEEYNEQLEKWNERRKNP